MEGFRPAGLVEDFLAGLTGLVARGTRIVGLRVEVAAVVEEVAAAAVALWVVAGGWRLSARSPRAERSRPSTDVMSASERTGKTRKEELLQLQSASI